MLYNCRVGFRNCVSFSENCFDNLFLFRDYCLLFRLIFHLIYTTFRLCDVIKSILFSTLN